MNANIGSASCLINRLLLDKALEQFKSEYPSVLQQANNRLYSSISILIAPAHIVQMREVIASVENAVALPAREHQVLAKPVPSLALIFSEFMACALMFV